MKTDAAVAYAGKPGFSFETVEIEAPRPDEILVRVLGVGLCHTDLVFSSGAAPYPFPAVFGHEGSGVVEAVGAEVTKVSPGDSVLITFRSCGACDRCADGDAAYCRTMPLLNYTGARTDGTSALRNEAGPVASNFFGQSTFAGHAITYERNVVKVDPSLPVEIMGPLGCGIQTGAGAVIRSLAAKKGSAFLVTGGGSVGLSAVMGAKIQGCATIILVEPMESRRQLAMELGATHCIDPAAGDVAAAVRAIVPAGVDNALDTTGIPAVQAAALACLGSKATLGLVGVSAPGTLLPGDVNTVMTFGQSIKGIIEGDSDPDEFIPELIEHFKAGRLPFDKLVRKYRLSEINQAIAAQHHGECVKAVLIP
ncbi:NAD(P)-dependent alcohol dehydrogenase [Hyphomonas sp. WL0036]|uniref:NAD(P)-dependent alcohol dehydrogenase n=1 Tax=Hyphomonas sediminis TaxID=2866160 RepID=UPI001C807604|nr:NAD(P)-dependent alcohol dehydrogenase [Hyphomonas sediminis]MBY9067187.1 NAD(P)-dependent alcohol dehydrogenase [Hyphomonas sediminis]